MAAPSVVYKGRLSSIPKYVVLTGGRGYPAELQKRANRANQLVLIFPGRCYFLVKARGKKTVSSTNASMKVALVLAKTPVQPANNTSN